MPSSVMFVAIAGMCTLIAIVWMGIMAKAGKFHALGAMSDSQADKRLEQIVEQNSAEVARLRERVEVLEKLVTDDDRKLAGEIERLRTRPGA